MPKLFDKNENAFTATAQNLTNFNPNQGVSLPTWGVPERVKTNEAASLLNIFIAKM